MSFRLGLVTIVICTAAVLAMTSCSMSEDKNVADAAVKLFHTQLGSEKLHEIYSGTSDEFKKALYKKINSVFMRIDKAIALAH